MTCSKSRSWRPSLDFNEISIADTPPQMNHNDMNYPTPQDFDSLINWIKSIFWQDR